MIRKDKGKKGAIMKCLKLRDKVIKFTRNDMDRPKY